MIWSGWPDSNRRPLAPKASALAKLRYSPLTSDGSGPGRRDRTLGTAAGGLFRAGPTHPLDVRTPPLGRQPALSRGAARPCGPARGRRRRGGIGQDGSEPARRRLPVAQLGAVLGGGDREDSAGQPSGQGPQRSFLEHRRQRGRGGQVEGEFHPAVRGIDRLPARPRRSGKAPRQFPRRDHLAPDANRICHRTRIGCRCLAPSHRGLCSPRRRPVRPGRGIGVCVPRGRRPVGPGRESGPVFPEAGVPSAPGGNPGSCLHATFLPERWRSRRPGYVRGERCIGSGHPYRTVMATRCLAGRIPGGQRVARREP